MNLRQVRKKLKSVSNVKKITRSMQLVSAVKMKKSQTAVVEAKPYQDSLRLILGRVLPNIDKSYSRLLESKKLKERKNLYICISSNKGLCGSFNMDLMRYILKNIKYESSEFITIGKKVSSFLSKTGGKVLADFSSNHPLQSVSAVLSMALNSFLLHSFSSVYVVYNKFITTMKTESTIEKLLPVRMDEILSETDSKKSIYLVEPEPQFIIDDLLQSFIENRIRHIVIESEAGEHSARMIAMKNATDNANDVLYNLGLLGNKLRQEKITNELLDMITAKESVGN